MILEVPEQEAEIPPNILEYTKKNDIIIRDVNGKIYRFSMRMTAPTASLSPMWDTLVWIS